MCVTKLVGVRKLSYCLTNSNVKVFVSMVGHQDKPFTIVAALLSATTDVVMTITNSADMVVATKTFSNKKLVDFYTIADIKMESHIIYKIEFRSTQEVSLYELNLANMCLCKTTECE